MSDPLVVLTGRLAAQVLFGAARLSGGVEMAGAEVSSVSRGNPKTVLIVVVSSASKFSPVVLSRPLPKLEFESQTQLMKPPAEARTVVVL